MAGGMIRETLSDLATRHSEAKAFLRAYCKVMAGWIRRSTRPILDVAKLI